MRGERQRHRDRQTHSQTERQTDTDRQVCRDLQAGRVQWSDRGCVDHEQQCEINHFKIKSELRPDVNVPHTKQDRDCLKNGSSL